MSFLRWTQLFNFGITFNILHSIAKVLNKSNYTKLVGAEYVTTGKNVLSTAESKLGGST